MIPATVLRRQLAQDEQARLRRAIEESLSGASQAKLQRAKASEALVDIPERPRDIELEEQGEIQDLPAGQIFERSSVPAGQIFGDPADRPPSGPFGRAGVSELEKATRMVEARRVPETQLTMQEGAQEAVMERGRRRRRLSKAIAALDRQVRRKRQQRRDIRRRGGVKELKTVEQLEAQGVGLTAEEEAIIRRITGRARSAPKP